MEQNDLFDFELNEEEDYWSVTRYYGKGEEVILPASHEGKRVKKIGDAFSPYNKKIKRVIIPEGYTSIGEKAFYRCTGLSDIKLPESLTYIGKSAFRRCKSLKEINLPKLATIEDSTFRKCTGLTKINIPKGLQTIGDSAFYMCKKLTEINLPESLAVIESGAFSCCKSLTGINLPKGLVHIEGYAFLNCTGLTEIKFPESLTSIGWWAFQDCTGITNIKIPKNLTNIERGIFDRCTRLTEISVDENNPALCDVDGIVFDKTMTTLILVPAGKKGSYSVPEGIIRIETDAFDSRMEVTSISLPQSLFNTNSLKLDCGQLEHITVNEFNMDYCSIDGVLFDKGKRTLLVYPKNKDNTDYIVPDGTVYISDKAFYKCKHLVNITFPESIKLIGKRAFAECAGLKAITFPKSLQYIGEYVFGDCQNLKVIALSRKTIIEQKAFEGYEGYFVYFD